MTITLERPGTFRDRPVSSGIMTEPPNTLTRAQVGALVGDNGVSAHTVSVYLNESRPGGRYATHPFPAPDGHFGARPWWRADRAEEIREWAANRVGRGVGGGQPAHSRNQP